MSAHTYTFTDHGIPFLARLLLRGDKYGLDECLTHDDVRPVLEFYDARYPHTAYGQFVSRYRLATLDTCRAGGLCLDGGNADAWYIGAENMRAVLNWAMETLDPPKPGSLDARALLQLLVDSASLTDNAPGYECIPIETMAKARAALKGAAC